MQAVPCLAQSATNASCPLPCKISHQSNATGQLPCTINHTYNTSGQLPCTICQPPMQPISYIVKSASHQCKPSPYLPSVKWKVLIMRQIIKQGQPNCRVFFHDFDDSQRVPFYARIVRLMHVLCIASRQVAGLSYRGKSGKGLKRLAMWRKRV